MRFLRGCVGIDLGSKTIKAACLVKTYKGWIIDRLLKVKNPIGRTSLCEAKEIEMMVDSLSEIKAKLSCKRVVMGVPNRHMAFRNIYLPRLTTKELQEAIYWEFQEFASVFHGEFVSDYHIVEERPDYYRAFLAGAEKKHVMGYYQAAKRSGINLLALDVYPLAIERVFRPKEPSNTAAVLDMGLHDSDLAILERGKLYFSRHIPVGSSAIDREIAKMLFIDEDQAEAIKLGLGGNEKEEESKIREALLNFSKAITREILQFFHYYSLQTQGREVEMLVLAGEGNKVKFLQELLHTQLKIPVLKVNEVEFKFQIKPDVSNPDYMGYLNAIGFAMRR